MWLYKYRAIPRGDAVAIARLERIVNHGRLWCARPDTLNDPTEFAWTCDFSESEATVGLIAEVLQERKGRPVELARQIALSVVRGGRLAEFGTPIIENMIARTRDEIGVVCLGTSPDTGVLWERYGDNGAGVCVEIEVSDALMGNQLHRVVYDDARRLHIDDFLRARNDRSYAAAAYATLLTKSKAWEPEAEVRFLSQRQQVEVTLDGCRVSRVVLGARLDSETSEHVRRAIGGIDVGRAPDHRLTTACSRRRPRGS